MDHREEPRLLRLAAYEKAIQPGSAAWMAAEAPQSRPCSAALGRAGDAVADGVERDPQAVLDDGPVAGRPLHESVAGARRADDPALLSNPSKKVAHCYSGGRWSVAMGGKDQTVLARRAKPIPEGKASA